MTHAPIKLTENEAELAAMIGVEMQQDITKMSTALLKTITVQNPKELPDGLKIKKIVMHATVFYKIEDVEEDVSSVGIVTIDF